MSERQPLMSVPEIAARLNVSASTIRRLIARRELRVVRIGHQWRARAEDVEQLATPPDATPDVALRHEMSQAPTARMVAERPSWETTGTKQAAVSG